MKNRPIWMKLSLTVLVVVLVCISAFFLYGSGHRYMPYYPKQQTRIYLYGEEHGKAKTYQKEFELWRGHCENEGLRHLFLELPYFTAQYLNIWMRSKNDAILDELYHDSAARFLTFRMNRVFQRNQEIPSDNEIPWNGCRSSILLNR